MEQMKKVEDRRIRKTKKQIRFGLAKALEVKDVNSITVKELVEAADINRSTFYLHYNNVHALMDDVENEVLKDIKEIFSAYPIFEHIGSSRLIKDIFKYIYDNQEIIKALLGPNGRPEFKERLSRLIYEQCLLSASKDSGINLPKDFELAFSFYLTGCVGIIRKWLDPAYPSDSVEHVSEVASRLILTPMTEFAVN